MHRVNIKKRKKLILRITSYSVLIILTVITTAFLLLVARGYRFDSKSGEIVVSGLLLLDSQPDEAVITLDGEAKNNTPRRFVLPAGLHTVSLQAEGYRSWSKNINLEASSVEDVQYPLLIPEQLASEKQLGLPRTALVSQSPDAKKLFIYDSSQAAPSLVVLNAKKSTQSPLDLPEGITRSNNSLGTLTVVEWSSDSRYVLVQQAVQKTKRYLRIDTKSPGDTLDITKQLGGISLSNVHFVGKNSNQIYGIRESDLYAFDIKEATSRLLLKNIESYTAFKEDTISFVRRNKSNKADSLEAGLWRDGTTTVVHTAVRKKGTSLTRYIEYDGEQYLAVSLAGEKRITLYRNPLREPILKQQLPYAKMKLASPTLLTSSANGRFLMAQRGVSDVSVYDFDHDRQYKVSVPKNTGSITWFGAHHLLTRTADGTVYISDYDGTNLQKLLTTSAGMLYQSGNQEVLYGIGGTQSNQYIFTLDIVL